MKKAATTCCVSSPPLCLRFVTHAAVVALMHRGVCRRRTGASRSVLPPPRLRIAECAAAVAAPERWGSVPPPLWRIAHRGARYRCRRFTKCAVAAPAHRGARHMLSRRFVEHTVAAAVAHRGARRR